MCYLVRINEIDVGTIFHISKKKFKIGTVPTTSFDSETHTPMAPATDAAIVNEMPTGHPPC